MTSARDGQADAYMASLSFQDFWGQRFATRGQYFFTRVSSERIGSVFAYAAYRSDVTPNTVSLLGLLVMLTASGSLALAPQSDLFAWAALVLYQLGFGLDCADGQLARGTRRTSVFGAWLDNTCDHVRYAAIVLALGSNLVAASEVSGAIVVGSLFLLASGQAVALHTHSMLEGAEYRPHGLHGAMNCIKWVAKSLSDTPFFLLVICAVVKLPLMLALYISFIGALKLVESIALAMLRIKE